jgi:uncharacterized protein (TIGR02186 family)
MMRRPIRLLAFALIIVLAGRFALTVNDVRANGLASDVSERLIAITTAFVGGNVVVFGAIEDEGDIVITMQGPLLNQMVRRKSRVAGIWINRDRVEFEEAPSFFAIAASRDLDEIAAKPIRDQFQLGVDHLKLRLSGTSDFSVDEQAEFASALIRNKQKQGLYTEVPEPVTFLGEKLFRTTFTFPANVPPGLYRIEVLKLRNGNVIGAQQSSLQISKVGMEAEVFDFARESAALYGIVAIVIAVAAGWLAGVIFRRA